MENMEKKFGVQRNLYKREKSEFKVTEFATLKELQDYLINLRKEGFVFHGSTRKITVLEPKQANCTEKEDGNLQAVYFASNYDTARFCALCGGIPGKRRDSKKGGFNEETGEFEYDPEYPPKWQFSGEPSEIGYIYAVPKEKTRQLTNNNGKPIDEFISSEPIKPRLAIKIRREQFPFQIEKI